MQTTNREGNKTGNQAEYWDTIEQAKASELLNGGASSSLAFLPEKDVCEHGLGLQRHAQDLQTLRQNKKEIVEARTKQKHVLEKNMICVVKFV